MILVSGTSVPIRSVTTCPLAELEKASNVRRLQKPPLPVWLTTRQRLKHDVASSLLLQRRRRPGSKHRHVVLSTIRLQAYHFLRSVDTTPLAMPRSNSYDYLRPSSPLSTARSGRSSRGSDRAVQESRVSLTPTRADNPKRPRNDF